VGEIIEGPSWNWPVLVDWNCTVDILDYTSTR